MPPESENEVQRTDPVPNIGERNPTTQLALVNTNPKNSERALRVSVVTSFIKKKKLLTIKVLDRLKRNAAGTKDIELCHLRLQLKFR